MVYYAIAYEHEYTAAVTAASFEVTTLMRVKALIKAVRSISPAVIKKAWWRVGIAHGGVYYDAVIDSYNTKRFKHGTVFRRQTLPKVTDATLRRFFSYQNLALPPKGMNSSVHFKCTVC